MLDEKDALRFSRHVKNDKHVYCGVEFDFIALGFCIEKTFVAELGAIFGNIPK